MKGKWFKLQVPVVSPITFHFHFHAGSAEELKQHLGDDCSFSKCQRSTAKIFKMAEKSEQKYFTSDEVLQNILADQVDLSDNEDAQVITANPAEAIDSAVRELWSLRNQTANFVAFEEESTRSLTSLFDKWMRKTSSDPRANYKLYYYCWFTHC